MLARRYMYRLIALAILLGFAAFFFVPIMWLILAPTKTDYQLVHESPFAFGSFGTFAHTFNRVINYQGQLLLVWLKNSAIYSVGGTALALVAAIPAGYGLALTQFIGRRTLLGITLVVMIMPATALVLPLFLEASAVHLLGTVWAVILPFAFFPFGTSHPRSPRICSRQRESMEPASGACSATSRCPSRGRSSRSSLSSRSLRTGTTTTYRS
jgi:multiple sugar transport system permease protein